MTWRARVVVALTVAVCPLTIVAQPTTRQPRPLVTFEPTLTEPEALRPFLAQVDAGTDDFPLEAEAEALEQRLTDILGGWLAAGRSRPPVPAGLLADDFRGAALTDGTAQPVSVSDVLRVTRTAADAAPPALAPPAFAAGLARLVDDMQAVTVTEFLVTAIDAPAAGRVNTTVRFDIVGTHAGGGRAEHVGTWDIAWTRQGDAEPWRATRWRAGARTSSRSVRPLFTDVSARAFAGAPSYGAQLGLSLDAWMATIDGVLTRDSNGHHGVSVGDADGDGLDDLYVAQPAGLPNRLYRARGDGTYEDVTAQSGLGLLDDTAHSLFADLDNDGDQDLLLATSVQPMLLLNDGTGRFTRVPDAFTFATPLQGVLTGAALADADRDGDLDLYLCVYSYFFGAGEDKAGTPMPYHDARNGPPGVLLRNDGRGRFVDVTRESGLDAGNDRYHFAATWADFDEDGWPDLLVANDFGTKNLYRNLGASDGVARFEDVAAAAGVLDHGAGMSATALDYDNDGRLDIYVGNMWTAAGQRVTASPTFMPEVPEDVRALYRRHTRGNTLLRNRGDGTFEDRTLEASVAMGRWAWASDAVDVDSDGCQDLYVANGMLSRREAGPDLESFFWRQVVSRSPLTPIKGTSYDDAWRAVNLRLVRGSIARQQRNVLLRNDCQGRFDEVAGSMGLDLAQDGRSFAVLDLDADGDPDLAVMAARDAPQLRLFRNEHPQRAALGLRLTGSGRSNRDAIGARVRVVTDTAQVTRIVQASSGFLSQHSREVLIGLGDSTRIVSLTVDWPSGERQVFTDLALEARYTLREGGSPQGLPLRRSPSAPRVDDGDGRVGDGATTTAAAAHEAPPATSWLYEPFPLPAFTATDVRGGTQSLAALAGRPAALLFVRTDVEPAREALAALARDRARLAVAGVSVLAFALDPAEDAARVRDAVPAGMPVVHADRDLAVTWAIVHRHLFMYRQPLPLPSTFLLDAAGRVVRVYRGTVSPDDLVRDATAIDVDDATRLARALPFEGRFEGGLAVRNYLFYGRELLDEGLDAPAIEALTRAAATSPNASTLYRLGTLLAKTGDGARAREAYGRALTLDPGLAEAHNDLGALLAQAGDLDGAIMRFRQALATTPDYPDALNNLGYALLLRGEHGEARSLYERALALQPDFAEALNNLGLLLGREGDLPGAEARFRAALSRRPAYAAAANNLAVVLVRTGRADEAVTVLDAVLTHAPEATEAALTLARIHLGRGDTTAGLRVLERILQRDPAHPVALALAREYRPR